MLDLLKPYFMGLLKHLTDILTVSFFLTLELEIFLYTI